MSGLGKYIMLAGLVLFVIGLVVTFADRVPFLGRLPGDIHIERNGFSFHFPIVTCIVISVVASLVLWLISKR